MPGVTKAGRNPYRAVGPCDKCCRTLENLLQVKSSLLETPGLIVHLQLHAPPNSWETTSFIPSLQVAPSLQGSDCALVSFVPTSWNSVRAGS